MSTPSRSTRRPTTSSEDADGDGVSDTAAPTNKDQCKKDGYKAFNNPTFKNQGECVSYVATRK